MPLIVVVGTADGHGPATVAALVAALRRVGRVPAWYDGADLGVGGHVQERGVSSLRRAADMILAQPLADAGVLLCDPARLLRRGLPWEACDAAVFADADADPALAFVTHAARECAFTVGGDPAETAARVLAALGLG